MELWPAQGCGEAGRGISGKEGPGEAGRGGWGWWRRVWVWGLQCVWPDQPLEAPPPQKTMIQKLT